jgi:hypothetical protein
VDRSLGEMFYTVGEQIIGYLPKLLAGIILIAAGYLLGWIAKRVIIQVCVILRLERLLRSSRWGWEFEKADTRYALFGSIGSVGFFVVFLVFLDVALGIMRLTALSSLIERSVLVFPKLLISLVIVLLGWIIAARVSTGVLSALRKEDIPRPTLIARFVKAMLLVFFSAMAIAQLDVARQIVLIGFTVTLATLSMLAIVFAFFGGRQFVRKLLEHLDEE